ncbi:serine proteinase inhibitor [Hoylesella timonensis]|uniref:Serine proteinase inhibitor n=1 Tax=Hoylesella timonensis TaxID=386414 RepID=A0A2K0XLC5_9BACT|nr:serpin family protein [Hoylesella timonensis]PNP95326.1 serine proteinase inhibitor [Hoylesella timonensis]
MMKHFFPLIGACCLSVGMLTSCSEDEPVTPNVKYNPGTVKLTAAQQAQVENSNEFAWKFFKEVSKGEQQDVFVSPLSVTYALGMLANGAVGDTQKEILEGLEFRSGKVQDINSLCHQLMIESPKLDKSTQLSMANAVVVNKKIQLQPTFQSVVKKQYDALVASKDFGSPATLSFINQWASDHTQGMVPKILERINPDGVSYLLNALYFKGIWYRQFDKKHTKKEAFTKADGTKSQVQMMHQKERFFAAENDNYQTVVLPYGNGSYEMIVVLPREGKKLSDVLVAMNGKQWKDNLKNTYSSEVDLKLPRFTSVYNRELNDVLKLLGMNAMFDPSKANLTKMSAVSSFVSMVLQKAKIEVDEEGSKAAAVTVVETLETAAPPSKPIMFHADRPFMYAIAEHSTGTIFFMGTYQGK